MMETWLPHKLRTLRVRQGLTLIDAAKKTGVTRATLSELERGHRHPVAPTLVKIAKGYGVPVEELIEEPVPLGEAPEAGLTDAGLMKILLNPAASASEIEAARKMLLQQNRVLMVISALEEFVDHIELCLDKDVFDLEGIESFEEVVAGQYFNHKRYARREVLERGTSQQKAALEREEARMDKARSALREAYLDRFNQAKNEAKAEPASLSLLDDRRRAHEDRIASIERNIGEAA